MTWIMFLKEPSDSLCRMHHRSPIWIITHHTYLLRTSFYRTILRTSFHRTILRTSFHRTILRTSFHRTILRTSFYRTIFRTSFHRTILRTTVLISNIFIVIDILLFKQWIFTKNYMIFNLKRFWHIITAFVLFFSPPWRWPPHEWPKHVRDNYVIKFYS